MVKTAALVRLCGNGVLRGTLASRILSSSWVSDATTSSGILA